MIEAATTADTVQLVALWQACALTRPWNDPASDIALALEAAHATILVARDGDRIVGSVMAGFDGHRGWVYYLAVAPDARLAGLGRRLMAAAEAWLRSRGAPKLQLMVREGNDAALRFYHALGMERQDVAVLGRFLTGSAE